MQADSKNHYYPFTLRLAGLSNVTVCQDKTLLYIVPPKDALTIENLYCHLKMTFDSGVSAPDRVVEYIGVCNEMPLSLSDDPSYLRKIDLNVAADGDRKVDIELDLTSLLNKDHARYREYFDDPITDDFTYVIIKLADGCRGNNNVGTFNLWKLDALFTTRAIR